MKIIRRTLAAIALITATYLAVISGIELDITESIAWTGWSLLNGLRLIEG